MPTDYVVTADSARLDIALIHHFLSEESYWAKNIPRDVVERSIRNSLCFGAFAGSEQVGFARVVTDRATFAWVCDAFVVAAHRGRGVGKLLMQVMLSHPDLQGLRRWQLATRDAHELYRQFGFGEVEHPERQMQIIYRNIYG
jgi:GNAT superfamily N-acetyltransferase